MAGEDEKDKEKAQAAAEGPAKLDRREVLMGLSTVPALGLFGYAWNAAAPVPAGAGRRRPPRRRSPRPTCRRSTSRSSAPGRRARC